ncbi:MAG TPA: cytochrome c peroxidase [Steroidobacteraceae bacterium]|jgi:cytochrome c peroxidase
MSANFSKPGWLRLALAVVACVVGGAFALAPTHAQSPGSPPPQCAAQGTGLSLCAQVGEKLFFDTNLSASRQMACASCHDPNSHYAQSNTTPVQSGGPTLKTPGFRAVPSLTYKELTPAYSDDAANPDGISTNAPGGGYTWDGRANTLAAQATIPLLSSFEMANANAAAVVTTVENSSYAQLFMTAWGVNVFSDPATAFTDIGLSLQAYQLEDPDFHPYTSKYDYFATIALSNGKPVQLTAAELRGFNVALNPNGGNCFACHFNGQMVGGGGAVFTDFTFQAIGVPRNTNIPANVTRPGLPPTYYDLGLCTAENPAFPHTLPASAQYCGMFKTPTLRNTATRNVFFHNGVFNNLTDVINWYNTRDTNPSAWYPTVKGVVQKFNDLPTVYRSNLDDVDVPFDGLPLGGEPHMTSQDVADLKCFLQTLTDGYVQGVTAQDPNCIN